MNYAYSLLLLLSLASYLINGMDDDKERIKFTVMGDRSPELMELSPNFALEIVSEKIMKYLQQEVMNDRQCSCKPQRMIDRFTMYRELGLDNSKSWAPIERNTYSLKYALKPYLEGEEKTVSNEIIKELKGQDNIGLFNACMYDLQEKGDTNFALLISLMPILFNPETLRQKNYTIALEAFRHNPEVLNKAIFGLKIRLLKSKHIQLYSEEIEKLCSIDPSEKNNLDAEYRSCCNLINQQFFFNIGYNIKPLSSKRRITKEEKERYWQALRPTFHPEFCGQEAVSRYRAQVTSLLLMCNRFKNETKTPFNKALFLRIAPLFFEEFTDFKNHCNNAEIELNKEITLTDIEDSEQKPFFDNFPQWYAEKKKECFEGLDFETVKQILSYKFGK